MESGKESILDLIVGTYRLLESFQYARAREVLRSIPVRHLFILLSLFSCSHVSNSMNLFFMCRLKVCLDIGFR